MLPNVRHGSMNADFDHIVIIPVRRGHMNIADLPSSHTVADDTHDTRFHISIFNQTFATRYLVPRIVTTPIHERRSPAPNRLRRNVTCKTLAPHRTRCNGIRKTLVPQLGRTTKATEHDGT